MAPMMPTAANTPMYIPNFVFGWTSLASDHHLIQRAKTKLYISQLELILVNANSLENSVQTTQSATKNKNEPTALKPELVK